MSRLSDIMNDDEQAVFKKEGYSASSSSMIPTHHQSSSSSSFVTGLKPEPHSSYYTDQSYYHNSSTVSSPVQYNRAPSVGSSRSSPLHPGHSHSPRPDTMDPYGTGLSPMGQMAGHSNMRYMNQPDPSAGQVKYTPVTGRVSRAKKGIPVHNCNMCNKTFTRAEHLRRHQLSHGRPEFRCPAPGCEREFHRKDLLDRHQQRHESEGINGTNHNSISNNSSSHSMMPVMMSRDSIHSHAACGPQPSSSSQHQYERQSSRQDHSHPQRGADQHMFHSRGTSLRQSPKIANDATIPVASMYHTPTSVTACSPTNSAAITHHQHHRLYHHDHHLDGHTECNGYAMNQDSFNSLVSGTCDAYTAGIIEETHHHPRNMKMQFSTPVPEALPASAWGVTGAGQEGQYLDQVMSSPNYNLNTQGAAVMSGMAMEEHYSDLVAPMAYDEDGMPLDRQ